MAKVNANVELSPGYWKDDYYRIKFPDNTKRPEGRLRIEYSTLKHLLNSRELINPQITRLLDNRLRLADTSAIIREWFPNGGYVRESGPSVSRFTRQGVGAYVLEKVTEDAIKRHNAKVILAGFNTLEESYINFLDKNGFTPLIEGYRPRFKIIQPTKPLGTMEKLHRKIVLRL